jgi:hypothetical protein
LLFFSRFWQNEAKFINKIKPRAVEAALPGGERDTLHHIQQGAARRRRVLEGPFSRRIDAHPPTDHVSVRGDTAGQIGATTREVKVNDME